MNDEPSFGDDASPFGRLAAHFRDSGLAFHADPDGKSVQLFTAGACAVYNCRLQLTHDDRVLQTRIFYPVSARDPRLRPLVAETLARANHGLPLGKFDIDMDSGDMSHQLGQLLDPEGLDDAQIAAAFSAGLAAADRYFPAVMRVMFGGHTPADAVYLSELDVHAEAVAVPDNPQPSPKPAPKTPPASRRRPRPEPPAELPGLFDEPPGR